MYLASMEWSSRIMCVGIGCGVSTWWIRSLASRAVNPWSRLALSLPVLIFYSLAPLAFDPMTEVLSVTSTSFLLTWLAMYKVLAFCMHRGPLCHKWTYLQHNLLQHGPVLPQQEGIERAGRLQDACSSSQQLLIRYALKIGLLGGVVYAIVGLQPPKLVRHILYAFGIYSFVGVLMDSVSAVVLSLLGIQLAPTFDSPWLSTSMRDFWGRRWNIATASCLRILIYQPIIEGQFIPSNKPPVNPKRPSQLRRLAALSAVFFASGVMHEIIMWYNGSMSRNVLWFWFFMLQSPACLAEELLGKWMGSRGLKVPVLLQRALALGALEAMAWPLFFEPVEENGLADRVVSTIQNSYAALLQ